MLYLAFQAYLPLTQYIQDLWDNFYNKEMLKQKHHFSKDDKGIEYELVSLKNYIE
jgi:hypothetical protein